MRSLFGNSTVVPVVIASTWGTNVSLRWSISARAGSFCSNAPRGAASRYTTDICGSAIGCSVGVPRSVTPGRRPTATGGRRKSTWPVIAPLRAASMGRSAARTAAARTRAARSVRRKGSILCMSEPVQELPGERSLLAHTPAVARVVLERGAKLHVAEHRIAGTDLPAADWRFPCQRADAAGDRVEPEMIGTRRDGHARRQLVAAFQICPPGIETRPDGR